MNQAGRRVQEAGDTKTIRDSASQVSRATLGLREMLLRGALRPGQRIAEIPLSAKLGVSRTPLRLAFEKLEHEGLLKALPHTGFAATEFSIADIWDAIETPRHSGRRLCPARGRTFEQSRPTGTPAQTQSRHGRNFDDGRRRFHSVSRFERSFPSCHPGPREQQDPAARNRADLQVPVCLSQAHACSWPRLCPDRREIIPIAEEHHRALIDAIEHREGARAESLGREHARLTRRNLEEALADPNFLETIPGARLIKVRSVDRT